MEDFPRIKRLPPYVFGSVNALKLQARREGQDIIDFGMGNPDQPTPEHIVDKLVEAARNPRNHRYSASRGITKLRLAIADWYRRNYQVEIDPETEAIVTIGSKEGLAHLEQDQIGSIRSVKDHRMARLKLVKRASGFACASAGERGASEDLNPSLPHGPPDKIDGWNGLVA